ncbi:MAG: hypothetical protein GX118_06235 [Arcobacter butzleri]|nr:hypothetical protein [Aliarcobacter butzleri]
MKNIILIFIASILLNGCYMGSATYEVFERSRNYHIGKDNIPKSFGSDGRNIYSEDKYIYLSERPKGCVIGYLTNRDDKPEKVIGWIIISGKEFCKERQAWALSF